VKFKYRLPESWISKVAKMEEFANGGAQVTIRLKDGREVPKVLISNSTWIVAARGHKDLPFPLEDIVDIFQSDEDKKPHEQGGWDFWDSWE
jgi:hypothetical protein